MLMVSQVLYRAAQRAMRYMVSRDMRHGGRYHQLFPIPDCLFYSKNLNSECLGTVITRVCMWGGGGGGCDMDTTRDPKGCQDSLRVVRQLTWLMSIAKATLP